MAEEEGLFDWFDVAKTEEILESRKRVEDGLKDGDVARNLRVSRSNAYSLIETGRPSQEEITNAPPITAADQAWLESLPEHIRPLMLRVKFTRLLRRISASWIDVSGTRELFEELLLADRGDRAGFPPAVLQELHALRDHYFDDLHPDGKGRAFK